MKHTAVIIVITFFLSACNNGDVAIKINDNGKTMRLKIRAGNAEKPIDYDRKFNVKGMDSSQKKELTNHILDSLGLATLK